MKASLLKTALESIPSHRESPLTRNAVIERMTQASGLTTDQAAPTIAVTLDLLRLLDLVQESDEHIRLSGQTQTYCRNSLLWYLQNGRELLSNWDRNGTARDDISVQNLLEQAPYFLKALEERRRAFALAENLPLSASREQSCSVVLVKVSRDGKAYLLHQWDQEAERYQLIGGKQRASETPDQTATREFLEEISETKLVPGKNLFITRSRIPEIVEYDISRTYGALTKYQIHVFQASLTIQSLRMSETDRWFSLDEILRGETAAGAPIAPLASIIARANPGFLEALPASLDYRGELTVAELQVRVPSGHPTAESSEFPDHLSLDWMWKLIRKLPVHDVWILGALFTLLVTGSFAAGKFVEQWQSARQEPQAVFSQRSSDLPTGKPVAAPATPASGSR